MKTVLLLFVIIFNTESLQASHLLGGYIQATPVSGSSLTYRISAVLYLNEVTGKTGADQTDAIQICLGDGTTATAYRASRNINTTQTSSVDSYTLIHTYVGPNTYTITASISNRTITKTIANADNLLLTLRTTFTTNTPAMNQTPMAGYPPTGFYVNVNSKTTLSLRATDAEGDSLAYGLAKPLTTLSSSQSCTGQSVSSYQFPNDVSRQGTFKLNSRTGELVWDAPTEVGLYNLALTINEYRNGVLISQTTQELTLFVEDRPGTPGPIPSYEQAIEGLAGGLITATQPFADSDFRLTTFPNPVDDLLQVVIQLSNPAKASVQLLDENGRILHELLFSKSARQHEQVISMSSLTPGVYLLRATVNGRVLVRKVMKR